MSAETDGGEISQNTRVILPLYLQIVILFSVISMTITCVAGYFALVGNDKEHTDGIQVLRETKLDKTTYEKDRSNDKIYQELNSKKLDAIMRKLNIENY